jgi:hypothetical protein
MAQLGEMKMTQQTEQQQVEQLSEAQNKKNYHTLIQWYRAPRPGVAPCGYEFNDADPSAMGLIHCVDRTARDLTFELLNTAAQSPEFVEKGFAFHVAPHPANYQAIIAGFMENNVPSTIKVNSGKGVYANIAYEMGIYIRDHFNNEFSKDNLKTALLAIRPETAQEYAIEKEKRLQERDKTQRAKEYQQNARVAQGLEEAPAIEQNEVSARAAIGSIMERLIGAGMRDFAENQNNLIKEYLKEPHATHVKALALLEKHTSEYTALRKIKDLTTRSVGGTSGAIWRNRQHLETVLAKCNEYKFPAEKTAMILQDEVDFMVGARGVYGDIRGRKVNYEIEWGK